MAAWLPKFQELICGGFTPWHDDNTSKPCTLNSYKNIRAYKEVGGTLFRAIEVGSIGEAVSVSCQWFTNEISPCGNGVIDVNGNIVLGTPTENPALARSVKLIAGGKSYFAAQFTEGSPPHSAIPSLRAQVNQNNTQLTMPEKYSRVNWNAEGGDAAIIGTFGTTYLSGTEGIRVPLVAPETENDIIRTGPVYALIYMLEEELITAGDITDPVIGDVSDITRAGSPYGYIDITLSSADVVASTPTLYPRPTYGFDSIIFSTTITTSSPTGYSPINAATAGIQVVDVGGNKTGASSTDLPIGSPIGITYTATITVDGSIVSNISIIDFAAQTYTDLLFEINADLSDAVASLVDGNIVITSNSVGLGSTVSIVDTDLFSSLTGYIEILPAEDGEIPQVLNIYYDVDFSSIIDNGHTLTNHNVVFNGYEAQTIGELMTIIDNHGGVTTSIADNTNIKIESLSAGSGSRVLIDEYLSTALSGYGSPPVSGSPFDPFDPMWSNYSLLNYNGSGCGVPPNPCGSPACPNCSDGHTYSLTVELDEPVASSTLILANPEDIATYGELIDVIHVALGACNPRIIDLLDEPNNNNDKIRFTSSSIGDTSTADINIDGIWDMFEELNSGPQDILSDRALRNHGKNPSTDEGFVAPGGPYIKTYTGAPDEWVIFDSSIPQPELYNALGSPLPVDENDLPVDCG